jgi:hypothetical protein
MDNITLSFIVADVFIALYMLNAIIQTATRKVRSGCFSFILVLGALISGMVGVISYATSGDPLPPNAQLALAAGVITLIVMGIVLIVLDRRNTSYAGMYSRGILAVGTGILLGLIAFFVPVIPTSIIVAPTSTPITAAVASNNTAVVPSSGANIVATDAITNTPTPNITFTPTITRTALPSPSPTRTLRAYVPPTITPTPEELALTPNCGATVNTNLNVRAEDNSDSAVVAIIPSGRYISLISANLDQTWWKTEFDGAIGWISGDFITLDTSCEARS